MARGALAGGAGAHDDDDDDDGGEDGAEQGGAPRLGPDDALTEPEAAGSIGVPPPLAMPAGFVAAMREHRAVVRLGGEVADEHAAAVHAMRAAARCVGGAPPASTSTATPPPSAAGARPAPECGRDAWARLAAAVQALQTAADMMVRLPEVVTVGPHCRRRAGR